jgi:hypothetical protein
MNIIKEYIRKLNEHAKDRRHAEIRLDGLSYAFSEHVCKLFLWGNQNEDWKKDWSEEIWNYLKQVKELRLKPNNKMPKPKFFEEFFFFSDLGSIEEMDSLLTTAAHNLSRNHEYPNASFVNPKDAYVRYLDFVQYILAKIQNKSLDEQHVIDACNRYLVGGS